MDGPQLPVTPKLRENVASPCSRCDNAWEDGPKDLIFCEKCEKLKAWEEKECLQRISALET
jgi:hypothetical protein